MAPDYGYWYLILPCQMKTRDTDYPYGSLQFAAVVACSALAGKRHLPCSS